MKISFFLFAGLLPFAVLSQDTSKRKIIDVHLHARTFNYYGNPPMPNPVSGVQPKWKNDAEVVQMTLDTLKKYGVV